VRGKIVSVNFRLCDESGVAVRKDRIVRRLRAETSETLKWIAEHMHMGTWTHVTNRLYHSTENKSNNQTEMNLRQYQGLTPL
jgi:hypothetical protein